MFPSLAGSSCATVRTPGASLSGALLNPFVGEKNTVLKGGILQIGFHRGGVFKKGRRKRRRVMAEAVDEKHPVGEREEALRGIMQGLTRDIYLFDFGLTVKTIISYYIFKNCFVSW